MFVSCIYVRVYACVWGGGRRGVTCMYVCMCMCTCMPLCVCVCLCMCMCMQACSTCRCLQNLPWAVWLWQVLEHEAKPPFCYELGIFTENAQIPSCCLMLNRRGNGPASKCKNKDRCIVVTCTQSAPLKIRNIFTLSAPIRTPLNIYYSACRTNPQGWIALRTAPRD